VSGHAIEWVTYNETARVKQTRLNIAGYTAEVWLMPNGQWCTSAHWSLSSMHRSLFRDTWTDTEHEGRTAALKAIRRDAIDMAKLMGKVVAAVTAELGDSP